MRQLDADPLGARQHRHRRRGAGNRALHQRTTGIDRRIGRVDQRVVDDGRARHVGDTVFAHQREDLGGIDLAQADIDAGTRRNGPGEAPTVAVEHREGPEIDRMLAEAGGENVGDGVEIGAAVMGHDALRIACGARGVAERDGVPFVEREGAGEIGAAFGKGGFIFELPDSLAARIRYIVDVDHGRLRPGHQCEGFADHAGEFRIDQQKLGAAMVELECNGRGIEPDVERVEDCAGHRHREVDFVHRGQVRQHRRDGVAASDATPGQERGEAPAAFIGLCPGEAAALIDGTGQVRIDRRTAPEKAQRRQRHEVGRCLVEADAISALIWDHVDTLLILISELRIISHLSVYRRNDLPKAHEILVATF